MRLSISERLLIEELSNLHIGEEIIVALMVKVNNFEKADDVSSYLASHSDVTPLDLLKYVGSM